MSFEWPEGAPERCTLTIGVFDGVHIGHARIIDECVALARESECPAVGVTFDRAPEYVVAPERAMPQLCSLGRREELLRGEGLDEVVVLAFDPDLAALSADEFAEQLFSATEVVSVVVGENFRFGKGGAGDADTLAEAGGRHGATVVEEPLLMLEGAAVSSTRIREALLAGDVESAARWLGRAPEVEGVVVAGTGRGRELGYPTANLAVDPTLIIPEDGVYAGRAFWEGRSAPGAVSIGANPTFAGTKRHVEVHLLDTSEELLGQEIRVQLFARLREQKTFKGTDELAAAIGDDVTRTRTLVRAVSRSSRT
jgi:riboflavin kinase/FMN adenylyltransferase